jgi:hypothetical protein
MTKFKATDRNGKVHTRSSINRTYTHMVVSRPKIREFIVHKVDRDNFWYHMAFIDGTSRWLEKKPWESDEQYRKRAEYEVDRAKRALGNARTFDAYVEKLLDQHEAWAATVKVDFFTSEGWCSRLDLAQKLASSLAGHRAEVVILPVEVVG